MLKLIRPDAGDDIGSHASSSAMKMPRIRHSAPPHDGTNTDRYTTARNSHPAGNKQTDHYRHHPTGSRQHRLATRTGLQLDTRACQIQ
ncbi:MAG: hypothetical protein ABSA53_16095 [Streptosporangiaceae bacterium]|jgi:hypothetical protein